MNETIFVAHSVYLTPEERKILGCGPATIQTVGICVPVYVQAHKSPLSEVFVRYLLTTEEKVDNLLIELMPDGYKISLKDFKDFIPILNIQDGGSEYMVLHMNNIIEKDGISYNVNHQIVFKDVSVLERTTICEQLGQFLQLMAKK